MSTITFTVNTHADNDFYRDIYLFEILYSMKPVFLLKCTLRFFTLKFDLNVKHRYFSNKNHDLQKKFYRNLSIEIYRKKWGKIIELHVVHKWRHMQSK